ncbi:hypothetical protein [Wolbachia endosymbiont of Mansonella perstans]|uniref:hypothetical protein n=1 Tax=Wolbachia endosymbiont of Mansonella perstans TaxID=229526 RepID=UPI001CE156D2|nr:hypothetical protein [Wolbachia endosymbiont of Mansonella perstans]MCA4774009.1 hypothetical protein [Wolbachia endosymbiont of Mansonella perstans]
MKNNLKNERKTREKYYKLLKEQDIEINDLRKVIADKVRKIESLESEYKTRKKGKFSVIK